MKNQLGLLIVFCLLALAIAGKGRGKTLRNATARQGKVACFKAFLNCTRTAVAKGGDNAAAKKQCREALHICKERVKELLTKITGKKPGGEKRKGGNKGGHKGGHRGGQKGGQKHVCHCFKKFQNCIKRHHKPKNGTNGQKTTVHEEIFSNTESAVSESDDQEQMENPMKMDPRKKCARHFRCCLMRENCSKGSGNKQRRKNRGAKHKRRGKGKGRGKSKRKGGRKPKPLPILRECMMKARQKCQEKGSGKKGRKACAKFFTKCLESKCSKKTA